MKMLKKMLSIFLSAVIMVGMACVGSVSAGAVSKKVVFTGESSRDDTFPRIIPVDKGDEKGDIIYVDDEYAKGGDFVAYVNLEPTDIITYKVICDGKEYVLGLDPYFKSNNDNSEYNWEIPSWRAESDWEKLGTPDGTQITIPNITKSSINEIVRVYNNDLKTYRDYITGKITYKNETVNFDMIEYIKPQINSRIIYAIEHAKEGSNNVVIPYDLILSNVSEKPIKYEIIIEPGNGKTDSDSSGKQISGLKVSKISDKAYTGKAIKPTVTVKDGSKTLKKGTDYTLTYKNNTKIGKASVTIKGKGDYTGEKTVNFNIVPGSTTLKVTKKSDTKAAFSWKAIKGAEKYQIYYFTNGSNYKKLATVSGSKTSYTSSKLDFKKNDYKFKIRAYTKADGKTVYGAYSKAVTV